MSTSIILAKYFKSFIFFQPTGDHSSAVLNNFDFIRVIGRGSYAKVLMVNISQHRAGIFARIFNEMCEILFTVETRLREPMFIKISRLKFDILKPLNKDVSKADTGGKLLCNRFHMFRIPQNILEILDILIRMLRWYNRLV